MDLRGRVPYTRHKLDLTIPVSQSTVSEQAHPDKKLLRSNIRTMHEQGMSYREIAHMVGLHSTRVQQIVKDADENAQPAN